jgi:cytidine deaminase
MVKSQNISFIYSEYDNSDELENADQELVIAACKAAENAYAPYSDFRVGAAVRLSGGRIIIGTNVENAAFPSGICAERSALANASSNFPEDHPVTIAIAALISSGLTEDPVSPCGNCRQVIAEEEFRSGKAIRIILAGKKKIFVIEKIADLLPLQFNRKNMDIIPH